MLASALQAHLNSKLDDFLSGSSNPRFAIAFSGGGDSTALLKALAGHKDCAAIFIVDHGLRPESAKEAQLAKVRAETEHRFVEILTWSSGNIKTGLQEKARKARYALIGQACRENSIPFLVTGHTRDDQAETLFMRYERHTDWRGAAGMAEATFAPLWPELAGLTVLRPALGITREALRRYNRDNDLSWIEDPSNSNTDFKRIKTRTYLHNRPGLSADLIIAATELSRGRDAERDHLREIADQKVRFGRAGDITLSGRVPLQLLKLCIHAVSGSGVPLNTEALARLSMTMSKNAFKGATLGGVQIKPAGGKYHILRDSGAVLGRAGQSGIPNVNLSEKPILWDGRFWIKSQIPGAHVRPYWPNRQALKPEQTSKLKLVSQGARKTLPSVFIQDECISVPGGLDLADIHINSAVQAHMQGKLKRI